MKRILVLLLGVALLATTVITAQERPKVPLRWGAHLGLNYNMSGAGYGLWIPERANPDFPGSEYSFIPFVLNDGDGLGLYAGVNAQWNILDFLGIQARLSYDGRGLTVVDAETTDENLEPRNDEITFNTALINLDALAKLYLGDQFHFTGGAGVGLKINNTYDYKVGGQGDAVTGTEVPGASIVASFVGGLGYDIPLSDSKDDPQWFLTPFLEATWVVGMKEVDDKELQSGFSDGLTIVSIRGGVQFAFGAPEDQGEPAPAQSKFFRVTPPEDGVYKTRLANEYFPIVPYVFFDEGSTEIASVGSGGVERYNVITAAEKDDLVNKARNTVMDADHMADADETRYMQGRVYYNILNIAGYRLNETGSSVTLTGSAPKAKDGQVLADEVKQYLVDVWGIDPANIETKAVVNPAKPSGTARTPAADRPNAEIENRRVEIQSNDSTIMRYAVIKAEKKAREENEIYIQLITNENITSWQATVTGNGQRKSYGPYSVDSAYLDPTGLLLDDAHDEDFTVEVVATTADGRTLSDTEAFSMRLNDDPALIERHILLFDYSEDDPVARSRDFLKDVAPRVPDGAFVVVSGYTDNLGNDDFNLNLSKQRANDVKRILEELLQQDGRTATVRAVGYGEDSDRHPYPNTRPEGRMYNRTVIVDIIP